MLGNCKYLVKNSSVMKIELKASLMAASKIDLGFQTRAALSNVKPKLRDETIAQFRNDCCNGYKALVKKLQERSPLLYAFTRAVSCFDPNVIIEHPALAEKRLDSCLHTLQNNVWISGSFADNVKLEYMNVCRLSNNVAAMKTYDRSQKSIDQFWMEIISNSRSPHKHLLEFVKMILILSHGNAALERGFSINSESIIENQNEKSLVALRVVYDAIKISGSITSVPITKGMMLSVRMAHTNYGNIIQLKKMKKEIKLKKKTKKKKSTRN